MKNYDRINEIFAPGPEPKGHDSAVVLVGADAVKILEDAGMQIYSRYFDLTRTAVAKKLADDLVK